MKYTKCLLLILQLSLLEVPFRNAEGKVPPRGILQTERDADPTTPLAHLAAIFCSSDAPRGPHEARSRKTGERTSRHRHFRIGVRRERSPSQSLPQLRGQILDGKAGIQHNLGFGSAPQNQQCDRAVRIDFALVKLLHCPFIKSNKI